MIKGLLDSIKWEDIRSLPGESGHVPGAVLRLVGATSEEEANTAYWELDNRVVVQGQLFEAARWVVGPVLLALHSELPSPARRGLMNLLVEIALGIPDQSEYALGNEDLGKACRNELAKGLWCFYGLLEDADPQIRTSAIDILEAVETDRTRLLSIMGKMERLDKDAGVQRRAREVTSTV